MTVTIGFIGLGTMGEPMALNLVKAGTPLLVWNRTPAKARALEAAGAAVAVDVEEVFTRAATVILMLKDGAAIDAALGRGTPSFVQRVTGTRSFTWVRPRPSTHAGWKPTCGKQADTTSKRPSRARASQPRSANSW
jgi:hypothetical protein